MPARLAPAGLELTEVAGPSGIPTEAQYLERIELKTASLYAACCQGAALLADAAPEPRAKDKPSAAGLDFDFVAPAGHVPLEPDVDLAG